MSKIKKKKKIGHRPGLREMSLLNGPQGQRWRRHTLGREEMLNRDNPRKVLSTESGTAEEPNPG